MITADALSFRYKGGNGWIFRDVGFRVDDGAIFAILGPNGRGKTTLLKAILGLVRSENGSVTLGGPTGYVPQGMALPFPYRVLDLVVMGRARLLGPVAAPGAADYAAARAALDRLGCLGFAERPATKLSGGERQMVLIARALASDCRILVLDEPTSALDFRNQDRVLTTVQRLAREDGLTVLFTTHFPQHALHVADAALALHGPTDHRSGPVREILAEAALSQLYGLPIRAAQLDHDGRAVRTVVPVFGTGNAVAT